MKRNFITISLCTLLALSLGACEESIPPIYTGDEDIYEHGSGTSEDLEDESGENTPTHTEHTFVYEVVSGGHLLTCTGCDYEEFEPHYMVEATHNEGTHTSICICGASFEVCENTIYYSVTDENIHTELCTMCDYSVEGNHTNKGETDGNCEVCGYTAGLEYTENDDGYYYLSGYGTYTGTGLVFPNSYNGKEVRGTIGGGVFGAVRDSDEIVSLTYLSIPKNMVEIGYWDFINAPYLEEINFEVGSKLESIGSTAFGYTRDECIENSSKAFTELHLPSTLASIGNFVFEKHVYLENVTFGENSQLESISNSAFYYCHALESITIPASVVSINQEAFSECESLKTVTFEENSQLETIGYSSFYKCYALESITIPSSVTKIDDYAFQHCDELKSVTFEENSKLESIGRQAFCYCYALTEIEIPASVTTIGALAFQSCEKLESVSFEKDSKLETIDTQIFCYCYDLSEVEIPASVKTISNYAFYDCYALKSLSFEEGSQLETIGYSSFYKCNVLESLTIPSSVTKIDDYAFSYCYSLASLTFEKDSMLESIGKTAFEYNALTKLEIPASVTSISDWAFSDSSTLEEVTIEGSSDGTSKLTTLGAVFAYDTALKTVTLPGSITTITSDSWEEDGQTVYAYLFSGCTSLTTINFYGTQDQWNTLAATENLGIESSWNVTVNCLGSAD